MNIDLIELKFPPRGCEPIKMYLAGAESVEKVAARTAKEYGYNSATRLGWYLRFVPDPRPYAEPKETIEIYVL